MGNEFYSNCPGSQEYSHSCVMKHIVRKLHLSVCSLLTEWTKMRSVCFLIFQHSKQTLLIRLEWGSLLCRVSISVSVSLMTV